MVHHDVVGREAARTVEGFKSFLVDRRILVSEDDVDARENPGRVPV